MTYCYKFSMTAAKTKTRTKRMMKGFFLFAVVLNLYGVAITHARWLIVFALQSHERMIALSKSPATMLHCHKTLIDTGCICYIIIYIVLYTRSSSTYYLKMSKRNGEEINKRRIEYICKNASFSFSLITSTLIRIWYECKHKHARIMISAVTFLLQNICNESIEYFQLHVVHAIVVCV